MFPYMLGTSSVLIVVEIIINGVGTASLSNESNEIRNMNLLCEILDVKPAVNNLSVLFALFIESNQERSSESVD